MESMKTTPEFGTVLSVRERREGNVKVRYILFESEFRIDGNAVYSITLETHSEYGTSTASACDISRNKTDALNLFRLLADGLVTSCTLRDILEDIL